MRVLIDNCLPTGLRHHLVGHEVETVAYRDWGELTNGDLVAAAIDAGFDVIVSIDQGSDFGHAVRHQPIAAVLLPGSQGNRLPDVVPLVPRILEALGRAEPGDITRV